MYTKWKYGISKGNIIWITIPLFENSIVFAAIAKVYEKLLLKAIF